MTDGALTEAVRRFFVDDLPRALPSHEARPQQLDMALAVAAAMSEGTPLVVEAGTGTGKSLAYLVPAALWALAHDGRVVIATHTMALQAQLVRSDLPLLARAGVEVRSAQLVGRNNYPCRRRLALARDVANEAQRPVLDALSAWSDAGRARHRADLPFPVDADLWDDVLSDSDLTLSTRCEEHGRCHFYDARRDAARAQIVVVNQALLLTDLAVRAESGQGVLPTFQRLVIDEAHHIEESATGALASRLTTRAVQRAVAPLLDSARRPGALSLLRSALPALSTTSAIDALWHASNAAAAVLGGPPPATPQRLRTGGAATAVPEEAEMLGRLSTALDGARRALDALDSALAEPKGDAEAALLDVRRAARRLAAGAAVAAGHASAPSDGQERWIEAAGRSVEDGRALASAPVEVASTLRRVLWTPFPGCVATSATLAVAGSFASWAARVGPEGEARTLLVDSPFDHAQQAVLGLPRDLPPPDSDDWLRASAATVVDAVGLAGGGAFVLCTSHAAVRSYAAALRAGLRGVVVLAQGEAGRPLLLERFRSDANAVLVGTDSFWEGVSVTGDALRLVVIPRMPFRVPDDPLHQARAERAAALGLDPFRTLTLPDAVLKLRQGYGRLIRTRTDRGAVILLDRRLHDRSYGRVVLASLPPARRVTGPWRAVREALVGLYARGADPPAA
jgi:ATP-dependent DNA helicase DinG